MKAEIANHSKFLTRADVAEYYNRSSRWVSMSFKNGSIPPPINKKGSPRWTMRVLEEHTAARENAAIKCSVENNQ